VGRPRRAGRRAPGAPPPPPPRGVKAEKLHSETTRIAGRRRRCCNVRVELHLQQNNGEILRIYKLQAAEPTQQQCGAVSYRQVSISVMHYRRLTHNTNKIGNESINVNTMAHSHNVYVPSAFVTA
jgi:hypothetical protein